MTDLSPSGRTDILSRRVARRALWARLIRRRGGFAERGSPHTEEPVCTAFFASSWFAQIDSGGRRRFRVSGAGGASLIWMTWSPMGREASLNAREGSSELGEAFLRWRTRSSEFGEGFLPRRTMSFEFGEGFPASRTGSSEFGEAFLPLRMPSSEFGEAVLPLRTRALELGEAIPRIGIQSLPRVRSRIHVGKRYSARAVAAQSPGLKMIG